MRDKFPEALAAVNQLLFPKIRLAILLLAAAGQIPRAGSQPLPGSYAVDTVRYDWFDAARNREVPVKIYYPASHGGGSALFPVIIFSHGLGGSREGYQYLGEYWAAHGCVSVHLQHIGSDRAVFNGVGLLDLKEAMIMALADPQNTINRARDVSFAIDQLERLNATNSPLQSKLDLNRIGIAGHSFGAQTALVAVGEQLPVLMENLADRRIKAAIAMSVPVPEGVAPMLDDIRVHVFVMSGTEDVGFTRAEDRRVPFDRILTAGTALVIFNGVDHMTFSGHPGLRGREKDGKFQPLICVATTAFWDAHLRGDPQAQNWLNQGGFARFIGDEGRFEIK